MHNDVMEGAGGDEDGISDGEETRGSGDVLAKVTVGNAVPVAVGRSTGIKLPPPLPPPPPPPSIVRRGYTERREAEREPTTTPSPMHASADTDREPRTSNAMRARARTTRRRIACNEFPARFFVRSFVRSAYTRFLINFSILNATIASL